jgi:hypothetical protein
MPVGTAMSIGYDIICRVISGVWIFITWFYFDFLPFILKYIALPLFVLGVVMAIAFAGGTVLFTIAFFIFIYFFIKHTIF